MILIQEILDTTKALNNTFIYAKLICSVKSILPL